MAQYNWENCPDATRDQVTEFVRGCHEVLGEDLTGVYLHGSLAMGCFNPELSDLDILIISERELTQIDRQLFARLLLELSNQPHPIETSVLHRDQVYSGEHPYPYEYHYSEAWREQQAADLLDEAWGEPPHQPLTDPDLAAHIVITRERGIHLYGVPARQVLPEVPADDYVDALLYDFDEAVKEITRNPVYGVLNLCRVYWYLLKSAIASKDEAGVWAASYLPEEYRAVVSLALRVYRGGREAEFEKGTLRQFAAYIDHEVRNLLV